MSTFFFLKQTTSNYNLSFTINFFHGSVFLTYFECVSDLGSDNGAQDPIFFNIGILQAFGEGLILILFIDNLLIMFSNLV